MGYGKDTISDVFILYRDCTLLHACMQYCSSLHLKIQIQNNKDFYHSPIEKEIYFPAFCRRYWGFLLFIFPATSLSRHFTILYISVRLSKKFPAIYPIRWKLKLSFLWHWFPAFLTLLWCFEFDWPVRVWMGAGNQRTFIYANYEEFDSSTFDMTLHVQVALHPWILTPVGTSCCQRKCRGKYF